MNAAIIYTGAMRSFDKNWKNHAWYLWRLFPGATFFCATHDDEDFEKSKNLPEGSIIAKVKQPEQLEVPAGCPESWTPGRHYMHEPFPISVSPQAVVGQLWMMNVGYGMLSAQGDPKRFDVVVRVRPDIYFHRLEWPGGAPTPAAAYTPWWGRFGGVNDRFAILGKDAAAAYLQTYARLQELIDAGAPLHPETLVQASMELDRVTIHDNMQAEFSTIRVTGEVRPPEILTSDLWRD